MSDVVVVFHSGYGHTLRVAQEVAQAAGADMVAIDADGNISVDDWAALAAAKAIVLGAPTYMGGPSWQFKKFADASSKAWFTRAWQDKLFAGFTCSASLNGDKALTLNYMAILAAQHGGVWVSLGLPPTNHSAATRNDLNNLGGSLGLLVQAPSDAGAHKIPVGDLATAKSFGERVARLAKG